MQVLAENLHRSGLKVFLGRWEVVGGDRLSQRLQEGLGRASVVVLEPLLQLRHAESRFFREGGTHGKREHK